LEDLSDAVHYQRAIFRLTEPYLGRRVLELGCGMGTMTRLWAPGRRVLGVDSSAGMLEIARKALSKHPGVSFRRSDLDRGWGSLRTFRPDTVVGVNLLEHLADDGKAFRRCRSILPSGGKLLLFVPANPALFNSLDRAVGHHRRYGREGLAVALRAAGFRILECRSLNLLGMLGWWWNGHVLGRETVPSWQIRAYDRWLGWFEARGGFPARAVGLSIFVAAERGRA
jgi:SAM-dependent methyltransferase